MITIDALRANLGSDTLAAVQLRPGHSHYNKALGRWQAVLWLDLIVAAPGWHSSRYRRRTLEHLLDPDVGAARAVAARFAQDAGVPLHVMDRNGSGWIAQQPAGPEIAWPVCWEATRWRSDGHRSTHTSTERCVARAGEAALQVATARVVARLNGSDRGLVRLQVHLALGGETCRSWHRETMAPHPDKAALRGQARGGARPSDMLRAAPDTTPLALMWAVADTFRLSLDDVAPVGAWRRGEISAAEMDRQISPLIIDNELKWGLGWLLAGAWHRQQPMRSAMLSYKVQGVSAIEMIVGLREGLRFSLPQAKEIVDMCCTPSHTDEAFEERFRACVAACR